MNFFKEFLHNRKSIGAILPSSKFLAKKMTSKIDYKNSEVIIELGAGTGVFTKEIMKHKDPNTVFIVFEINPQFYDFLFKTYLGMDNIFIINEKAENLNKVLKTFNISKVDYIISGLPFLNFKEECRLEIFKNVSEYLKKEFILFQYTNFLENEIKETFNVESRKKVFFNFPPAYVYSLENK